MITRRSSSTLGRKPAGVANANPRDVPVRIGQRDAAETRHATELVIRGLQVEAIQCKADVPDVVRKNPAVRVAREVIRRRGLKDAPERGITMDADQVVRSVDSPIVIGEMHMQDHRAPPTEHRRKTTPSSPHRRIGSRVEGDDDGAPLPRDTVEVWQGALFVDTPSLRIGGLTDAPAPVPAPTEADREQRTARTSCGRLDRQRRLLALDADGRHCHVRQRRARAGSEVEMAHISRGLSVLPTGLTRRGVDRRRVQSDAKRDALLRLGIDVRELNTAEVARASVQAEQVSRVRVIHTPHAGRLEDCRVNAEGLVALDVLRRHHAALRSCARSQSAARVTATICSCVPPASGWCRRAMTRTLAEMRQSVTAGSHRTKVVDCRWCVCVRLAHSRCHRSLLARGGDGAAEALPGARRSLCFRGYAAQVAHASYVARRHACRSPGNTRSGGGKWPDRSQR